MDVYLQSPSVSHSVPFCTQLRPSFSDESIPLPRTWRKKIEDGTGKGGFSELRPFYRLFLFTPLELLEDSWLSSDMKMTAMDLLKVSLCCL